MSTISTRREHTTISVVLPGTLSVYPGNTKPLSVVDVVKDGAELTVHLFRGTSFTDDQGDEVTPLGYLCNTEYFTLCSMLEYTDEQGVTHPRTLPMDWDEIDQMIIQMREEAFDE